MAGGVYLEIDASELNDEIKRLREVLTPQRVEQVMARIFRRTGGHVRQILKKDLPRQYYARPREIGEAVKNPKLSSGVMGVGCTIPIRAPRKNIGSGFAASGGAHGWASLRRKYRVKARIVKSGQSTLPAKMEDQGDMPPFRNLGSRLGGLTFTRKGKARLPIVRVSGIGIPQMPMNRSKQDVKRDIMTYMRNRMEHEIQWEIAHGR
jgi:hypothetical protein